MQNMQNINYYKAHLFIICLLYDTRPNIVEVARPRWQYRLSHILHPASRAGIWKNMGGYQLLPWGNPKEAMVERKSCNIKYLHSQYPYLQPCDGNQLPTIESSPQIEHPDIQF